MYYFKRSHLILLIFLILSFTHNKNFANILSPAAEISLLTASPGDELYSVFGHSGLRVYDPQNNIDLVFNYGTFDFETQNFYLKFIRGKLLYKLSVVPMKYFIPEYQNEGRAIFEQVLGIPLEQKQLLFEYLINNALPENAYYHYDFFYDNCATRIRDVVDVVLNPNWPDRYEINTQSLALVKSHFNYEFDYQPDFSDKRTFRDLLQPYLLTMPWSAFGIDLALGLHADKVATAEEFMYLPDEMLIAFDLALLPDGNPLVSERRIVLFKSVELSPASVIRPYMLTWMIFVLGILSLLNKRFSLLFDRAFFTLGGTIGLVIMFLWFFTDHITTKTNLNILWALPSHLYFIWKTDVLKNWGFKKTYFRLVGFILLAIIILWSFIPQAFHPSFFPLVLISLVKSIPYMQLLSRNKHNIK